MSAKEHRRVTGPAGFCFRLAPPLSCVTRPAMPLVPPVASRTGHTEQRRGHPSAYAGTRLRVGRFGVHHAPLYPSVSFASSTTFARSPACLRARSVFVSRHRPDQCADSQHHGCRSEPYRRHCDHRHPALLALLRSDRFGFRHRRRCREQRRLYRHRLHFRTQQLVGLPHPHRRRHARLRHESSQPGLCGRRSHGHRSWQGRPVHGSCPG